MAFSRYGHVYTESIHTTFPSCPDAINRRVRYKRKEKEEFYEGGKRKKREKKNGNVRERLTENSTLREEMEATAFIPYGKGGEKVDASNSIEAITLR
jgi:hypothetical protein